MTTREISHIKNFHDFHGFNYNFGFKVFFFLVSAATTAIKNEKALYTFNPKTISNDQISKWVKTGNLEQLEIATLMGKGKQLLGKTSWNDATRNYIKNVQNVMDDLDAVFKCVEAGDVAKLKTLLEKNIKYVFARDNQGRSPLQVAAQNGQKEVTQCIIAENAEYTQITDPVSNDIFHQIFNLFKEMD